MPLTGHPQRSSAIATFCRGVFLWTSAVCLKGNTFGGSCDPRAGIGGSLKPKGLEPKQLGLVYDALLCFVYVYIYMCVHLTLQGWNVEECKANVVVSRLLGHLEVYSWQVEISWSEHIGFRKPYMSHCRHKYMTSGRRYCWHTELAKYKLYIYI